MKRAYVSAAVGVFLIGCSAAEQKTVRADRIERAKLIAGSNMFQNALQGHEKKRLHKLYELELRQELAKRGVICPPIKKETEVWSGNMHSGDAWGWFVLKKRI